MKISFLKSKYLSNSFSFIIIFLASLFLFSVSSVLKYSFKIKHKDINTRFNDMSQLIRKVKSYRYKSTNLSIDKSVFEGDNISFFMNSLISIINKNSLKILSIKPDEKTVYTSPGGLSHKNILLFPLELRVKGSFFDIYSFLFNLENFKHFVLEKTVVIEKIDNTNVEISIYIEFISKLKETTG